MSKLTEYIAESAFRDSEGVIQSREYAAQKRFDYKTRLMFDGFAAAGEQRIVDKANKLIDMATQ